MKKLELLPCDWTPQWISRYIQHYTGIYDFTLSSPVDYFYGAQRANKELTHVVISHLNFNFSKSRLWWPQCFKHRCCKVDTQDECHKFSIRPQLEMWSQSFLLSLKCFCTTLWCHSKDDLWAIKGQMSSGHRFLLLDTLFDFLIISKGWTKSLFCKSQVCLKSLLSSPKLSPK